MRHLLRRSSLRRWKKNDEGRECYSLHLTLDYPPKSHGGISTAVGAVGTPYSRNEGKGLRWLLATTIGVPKQREGRKYRREMMFGAYKAQRRPERSQKKSLSVRSIAGRGSSSTLLWEDGMTLAKRLKAPTDFVVHVDLAHVADICPRSSASSSSSSVAYYLVKQIGYWRFHGTWQERWKQNYPKARILR